MIRIATRASELAMWQARRVQGLLAAVGVASSLVTVTTEGDRDLRPFVQLEGSGFFTKAVQEAVLRGDADAAVHSYKDLPGAQVPGLVVAAVPERADPRDVLVCRPEAHDPDAARLPLAAGALVGTSAARRRAQVAAARPDLRLTDLRGNVPTRVARVRAGELDAAVLAKAGLDRLGLDLGGLVCAVLEPEVLMPAPAQGALAVEATPELAGALGAIDDPAARRLVAAERMLLTRFDAGCQLALGALARDAGGHVELSAWYEGRRATVAAATPEAAASAAFAALTGGGEASPRPAVGLGRAP